TILEASSFIITRYASDKQEKIRKGYDIQVPLFTNDPFITQPFSSPEYTPLNVVIFLYMPASTQNFLL
ncbi:hypothetical protein, partial [Mesorhizobium sp. M3A.F.Ca.ET.174.01.1.1]|uniref:hypothetical protein n=1 Tax=Mesorhizobium sp. M3A.F.Ca.ET.174.01.1.1 TaxID=2563944 RepID=UPI001AEF060E